jgi:hypothetical protein
MTRLHTGTPKPFPGTMYGSRTPWDPNEFTWDDNEIHVVNAGGETPGDIVEVGVYALVSIEKRRLSISPVDPIK